MHKRWTLLATSEEKVNHLHQTLKINKSLCNILVQRGIETFDQAKDFFRPQLTQLHDPWLMKDMDKAVSRILSAINSNEKILVFGDYDVDGTTSVATVFQFLSKIYDQERLEFYIPHRYREGYGVSKAGIDFAKENGFNLIISLDCGIKSTDLIAYAKTLEIDFIVCDHHLPDAILPPAVAILNPKQKDCNYPFKELCGCGVGFKLISALCDELNLSEYEYLEYIDMVSTAIAADIVPMTDENRILAFFGLKKVNENPSNGIKALIQLSGLKDKLHINNLVFMIAPRVNAAGRMDDARKAVLMFIEKDYDKALKYAEMLHSDNDDRKDADRSITEEALALIEETEKIKKRKTTVVYRDHWHKGVVGIVASRLIETYYRPTIVLTRSNDVISGSARSVRGFNLYEAIHSCREHLLGYGGHFYAAGLTMEPGQLNAFSEKFEAVVNSSILPDQLIPEIVIDAETHLKDLNPSFYNIILQMEPFGPENLRPVFLLKQMHDTGYSKIVKEDHLRFVLRQNNHTITGIGFGLANKFPLLQMSPAIDVVCTLDENEWNGEKSLQLKVIDFRPSGS